MGTKNLTDALPQDKALLDSWTIALINARFLAEKGLANGVAPLGADGLVPSANLPNISLTWGSITGVLSDQTDLLTALGAKASLASPAFTGTPTIDGVPINISDYGIIQGSNANGEYIKFPDGTLICYRYGTANLITDSTFGNLFVSASTTLTFPLAFIALPTVMPTCTGNYEYTWAVQMTAPTITYCKLSVVSSFGLNGVGNPGYTAIGRWK